MNNIKTILNEVNKQMDGKAILILASELDDSYADRIPTGSLGLDCVCGGGLPRIGLSEFIGMESAGKTMLSLKAACEVQKKYKDEARIAYVSVEAPLDINWVKKLGVELDDRLIEVRADSGEDYLNSLKEIINSNTFQLVIIDSMAALTSMAELEGLIGDAHVANRARLLGAFVRHCVWGAKKEDARNINKTCIIGINQFQAKIGGFSPMGMPKESKGGYTLRYAKLIDIEMSSGQQITEGSGENKVIYGKQIKYRITKSKAGCSEGGAGSFDYISADYGPLKAGQIDIAKEYRICGIKYGLITRGGRYFKYMDKNYEKEELENLIRENEKFKEDLIIKIINGAISSPLPEAEE